MITLPSILYALALTFLIAMLLIGAFNIRGALLGLISQLILAFATVEFYKLLTT